MFLGGIFARRTAAGYNHGEWVHCGGLYLRRGAPLDVQDQGRLSKGMEVVLLGVLIVVVPLMIIGFVAEWQEKKLRKKLGEE